MNRIALYLRVSTNEQSCDLQRKELTAYCEARGWTEVTIYEDHGKTGTNGDRPALKRMIEDAKQRKFDILAIWKLDRLFRSLKHLVTTLSLLEEIGVQFISLKDNLDLTTSSGVLMMHMIGAFSQFEASLIKARVIAGLENAKANGKVLGRPKRLDSDRIAMLRDQGMSLSQIAAELKCTKSAVSKTLKNAGYKTSIVTTVEKK